ncbi:uncharacterized protein LOC141594884 [Silene latifolia]|uniref:uncharacterized protein LOC141594884 n=1 Tax=Silene latifolia TaxID=37657 RepID=UPI003D7741F5
MVQDMIEQVHLIRQNMKATQDRQKSYTDLHPSGRQSSFESVTYAWHYEVLQMREVEPEIHRYVSDPSHVLEVENIELDEALTYVEVPKKILDRKVRKIRNGETILVKVLWSNHNVEEATWEPEEAMRERYPHVFSQV